LSQFPCQAELLSAGAKIINGGDHGIPHKLDCPGDVCISYEGEDGFATVTTSNEVELQVSQIYGLRLEPATVTVSGKKGQTISRNFTIENTGNGKDTVTFRVVGTDWGTSVSPDTVTIEPGGKERVSFKVTIPKKSGKPSTITLIAVSSGKDESGKVSKVSSTIVVNVVPQSCCALP
ncbi:MAG: hypothetical protein AAB296_08190, partial [Candidatus Desantisbacteria bacterium]